VQDEERLEKGRAAGNIFVFAMGGDRSPVIIAIDGPAGAGKSTIARRLAERLGYLYIDTGAMYRAVALAALRRGLSLADEEQLSRLARTVRIELDYPPPRVLLDGEDVTQAIRAPEVSEAASQISTLPTVRRALVEQQRAIARKRSVVMEGRDIGTVVFPEAQLKVYLDARPEVRARRRWLDLVAQGRSPTEAELLREITLRDQRDMTRHDSPLRRAPDAVYLDTSSMTIDEVERAILDLLHQRIHNER